MVIIIIIIMIIRPLHYVIFTNVVIIMTDIVLCFYFCLLLYIDVFHIEARVFRTIAFTGSRNFYRIDTPKFT